MQKFTIQKNHQREKITNIFTWLIVFLVGGLLIIKVVIANQSVGSSEKLHNLDIKIAQQKAENEMLAETVRRQESLIASEDKARRLGFIKNDKFSFLPTNDAVAFGQTNFSIR